MIATAGDTALIVLAGFWGLLVLGLCIVLLNTFRVLESTKVTIDTMREETEERRVGKECIAVCRSRWSPYH